MNYSALPALRCIFGSAVLAAVAVCSPATAVVVISDGFGDADLNNNGTPLEDVDVNVQGSLEDTTWIPGRLFVDGMSGEPENTEVDSVLDGSDEGIRWLQMRGWTSAQGNFPGVGDSKPTIRIVNDGSQVETTGGTGGISRPSLDGYAMSWESKGGGSSVAGFFDQNIELGPEVGDEVKVSFDFRLWGDTPNAEELMPDASELRFGLYQDTDNQLGMENRYAGRQVDDNGDPLSDPTNLLTPEDLTDSFRPAVWGQDEGLFHGRLSDAGIDDPVADIGTRGDAGYSVGVFVGDNFTNEQQVNGGGARIREEVNTGRILEGSGVSSGGDVETIAQPENLGDEFDPVFDYVNMDTEKAYNLSLSLVRATDTEAGDSIEATLTITDLATMQSFPLTGLDTDPQSDSWDYFALRNASSGSNEIDFLIDNFMLEVNGSNAPTDIPGDFSGDGKVDGADLSLLLGFWGDPVPPTPEGWDGSPPTGDLIDSSELSELLGNWGAGVGELAAGGATIPEPSTILLLSVGAFCGLARASRRS